MIDRRKADPWDTYGVFNCNAVMEYPHEPAVADGVNCYEVYKIRRQIAAQGAKEETPQGVEQVEIVLGELEALLRRWLAPDSPAEWSMHAR